MIQHCFTRNFKLELFGETESEIYTEEGKKQLQEKYNVTYIDGIYALRIDEDEITLFLESDGKLIEQISFHKDWLPDLEKTIKKFKEENKI